MARRVVCISYADGAGGAEVAHTVARRLGFLYVDEQIIAEAAQRGRVPAAALVEAEQRKSFATRLVEGLRKTPLARDPWRDPEQAAPTEERYRALIRDAIYDAGEQGSVVIAAHAASLALGRRRDALRVLVTASAETRARRIASERGITPAEAAKAVRDGDAARADYLQRFYGIERELPTHFDLVLNTETLAPEEATELIVRAAGLRAASGGRHGKDGED